MKNAGNVVESGTESQKGGAKKQISLESLVCRKRNRKDPL